MASVPPSSLPPGGIPTGGNGKYIAAVLLLLLVVGGLAAWKLTQKDPAPVVTVLDAGTPVRATHPDEDDIPPPPPIEDASVEDTGAKKVVQTGGNSLGCEAPKCKTALSSDLETAIAFRGKQAHRCYDNALAGDPNLQGKMTIALKIGSSGAVCGANVASNDLANPSVAQCVANYYRNGSFPAPKGGCSVELNVPLNFVKR